LANALRDQYTVYTNPDGDRQGIICARYHLDKFGFVPLIFSKGFLRSFNYRAKDFGEYVVKYGKHNAFMLFLEVLTVLEIYDFTDVIRERSSS